MAQKILIIDDESYVRSWLRKYLESEGFEVSEAKSGTEGLKKFSSLPCDLILADIEMPDMNGFETIEKLRSRFPLANIVAMSGCMVHKTESFQKAVKLGAKSTLQKPADYYRTIQAVNDALQID